jgi:hypothetical protein
MRPLWLLDSVLTSGFVRRYSVRRQKTATDPRSSRSPQRRLSASGQAESYKHRLCHPLPRWRCIEGEALLSSLSLISQWNLPLPDFSAQSAFIEAVFSFALFRSWALPPLARFLASLEASAAALRFSAISSRSLSFALVRSGISLGFPCCAFPPTR